MYSDWTSIIKYLKIQHVSPIGSVSMSCISPPNQSRTASRLCPRPGSRFVEHIRWCNPSIRHKLVIPVWIASPCLLVLHHLMIFKLGFWVDKHQHLECVNVHHHPYKLGQTPDHPINTFLCFRSDLWYPWQAYRTVTAVASKMPFSEARFLR